MTSAKVDKKYLLNQKSDKLFPLVGNLGPNWNTITFLTVIEGKINKKSIKRASKYKNPKMRLLVPHGFCRVF